MVLGDAAALIAPPNDVVNENVAALEALAATRSVNAMLNAGLVTLSPIAPDATDAETVVSTLDITLTLPPALAAPKVKPESVTVTAVLAAIVAPAVVMTMEVVPGAEMGPREALPDTATVGVGLAAKKLLG